MHSHAETREAVAVFGKWIHWQQVLADCSPTDFADALDDGFWGRFATNRLAAHHPLGSPALLLFDVPFMTDRVAALRALHAFLDHDLPGLRDLLRRHHLLSPAIDHLEASQPVAAVIDKYRHFVTALFDFADPALKAAALFAVGNRIAEFCLGDAKRDAYRVLLTRPEDRPFARLLHSLLWRTLSGDGWRDWHRSTLDHLKAESDVGHTVVYVAGGCDFYQLLRHGIYNIEVIDPLLPSQSEFYSEGWDWLIADQTLGDCITLDFGDRQSSGTAEPFRSDGLILRRDSHQVAGDFEALLSTGETALLPRCKVGWGVYATHDERRLGGVTLHRRFAQKSDFESTPGRTLLMSFNEFSLVTISRDLGGWGLDLDDLDPTGVVHVKQLRTPASIRTLNRLHEAESLPFKFINLGGCAT